MKIAVPDSAVEAILPAVADFLSAPKMVVGGQSCEALSGKTFAVYDPATGGEIAQVPAGGVEDVNAAVAAARAAFEGPWSNMSAMARQSLMLKLADLIEENGEELAQIETLENGKNVMISRLIEVQSSAEYIRYMAGWATKIYGQTFDVSIAIPEGTKYQAQTRKEAVGVVAAVTPWNFPLNMAVWKIAPALAAGCTVVLKPAEETPLTSMYLAKLCLEAGFPEGTVNVITGTGAVFNRANLQLGDTCQSSSHNRGLTSQVGEEETVARQTVEGLAGVQAELLGVAQEQRRQGDVAGGHVGVDGVAVLRSRGFPLLRVVPLGCGVLTSREGLGARRNQPSTGEDHLLAEVCLPHVRAGLQAIEENGEHGVMKDAL